MMSRITGITLQSEIDHIRQSIQDIVTTPIGTRVMRGSYGSLISQLIDGPFNDITKLQLYAATATALIRWEDRINLESVTIEYIEEGKFNLDLGFQLVNTNQKESLSIPLNFGAAS